MNAIASYVSISLTIGLAVAALETWIDGPRTPAQWRRAWPGLLALVVFAAAGWPLFVLGGIL